MVEVSSLKGFCCELSDAHIPGDVPGKQGPSNQILKCESGQQITASTTDNKIRSYRVYKGPSGGCEGRWIESRLLSPPHHHSYLFQPVFSLPSSLVSWYHGHCGPGFTVLHYPLARWPLSFCCYLQILMCHVCEQAKVFPFLMCWQRVVSVVATSLERAGLRSGPKIFGRGGERRIISQRGVSV